MIIGPQHGIPLPDGLSRSEDKLALYAADTYFRESWEDLSEVAGAAAADVAAELATITLKPDALAGRVLRPTFRWLASEGFSLVTAEMLVFDRHTIRATWVYTWNVATRDRKDVVDILLGMSPSLVLVLRGPAGHIPPSTRLSERKGPAVPERRVPGQLRHGLGNYSTLLNFVHTADEPADLIRELGVYFPAEVRRRIYSKALGAASTFEEAHRLASELEAAYPAHDLSLNGAVAELVKQLGELGAPGNGLRSQLSEAAAGRSRDWRALLHEVDNLGLTCSPWARLVIMTHMVHMDTPAGEVLLQGVSSRGPREHTAA
jgi:nucleoside diphosphate kinase